MAPFERALMRKGKRALKVPHFCAGASIASDNINFHNLSARRDREIDAQPTLLDEGQLQPLPCGVMQHAVDPVTGYWYQTYHDTMSMDPAKTHHGPPKLPGLQVTITPGD
jgi:hypothetical protein